MPASAGSVPVPRRTACLLLMPCRACLRLPLAGLHPRLPGGGVGPRHPQAPDQGLPVPALLRRLTGGRLTLRRAVQALPGGGSCMGSGRSARSAALPLLPGSAARVAGAQSACADAAQVLNSCTAAGVPTALSWAATKRRGIRYVKDRCARTAGRLARAAGSGNNAACAAALFELAASQAWATLLPEFRKMQVCCCM